MSSPPSKEQQEESASSLLNSDEALFAEAESVLRKQLVIEKTRVAQLTNDNQRLLSQNIGLCQAVQQQKLKIDDLNAKNEQLQNQISKLFLTIRALDKTNKQKSLKDAELQKSLKNEFVVLKETLSKREDEIVNLHGIHTTLSEEIEHKQNTCKELQQINHKYEASIKEHSHSIHSLQEEINAKNKLLTDKDDKIEELLQRIEINLRNYNIEIERNKVENELNELDCTHASCGPIVEPFRESFKTQILQSIQDIENVDKNKLLLCQNTHQLKDFILSSNMPKHVQSKVSAQLLPVVERYRINLQKDINRKIDTISKRKNAYNKMIHVRD